MTHAKRPELACILILGLSLLLTAAEGSASNTDKIYKWADQNGEIQYTQLPPPYGVQVLEIINTPPPASDGAEERAKLQQEVDAMDERMTERQEDADQAEQRAHNEEIRRQNCITAKRNLSQLQQGGNMRYRTADGEVTSVTQSAIESGDFRI